MENIYKNETNDTDENITDKILDFSLRYEVPAKKSKEDAFAELSRKINLASAKKAKTPRINRYAYISIAASIVIFLGLWFGYTQTASVNLIVENGSQLKYLLPDGSEIVMNAGSEVSFNKYTFNSTRELTLKGEGYFDVEKGEKFTVKTINGTVEVLGTTLNITSRKNIFRVSCYTGKVKVSNKTNSEIISAGETVKLIENKLSKKNIETSTNEPEWMNGEFYFEDLELILIFEELERKFNVTIKTQNVDKRYFSGKLSNANLEEVLDIICTSMNLNYDIQSDKEIIISGK